MDNDKQEFETFSELLKEVSLPPITQENLFSDGQVVDKWRLTALLGRGGSGEVYRAEPIDGDGEAVAIKFLRSSDVYHNRMRFMREIAILQEHSHRNLQRFIASGELNGHLYIVTELLEPYDLPTTDREIAHFILDLSDGVAYLHALGLVHRDIKPSNVMSRNGTPVLIDLGLVKDVTQPEVKIEDTISIVDGRAMGFGTPSYAAPEQFEGGKITPCSDVHALGVFIDQCFKSRPPRCWQSIIQKATSSRATLRYKTVGDLVKAIRYRHLARYASIGITVALLAVASLAFVFRDYLLQSLPKKIDLPSYGLALGVEGQKWNTSPHKPWVVIEEACYEGTKAVLSSGDNAGTDKTWLEMTLPKNVKTMTVVFQKAYYNSRFSIEIDGNAKYIDQSVSLPSRMNWIYKTIEIPPNSKTAKFVYEHSGTGYRYQHNGVCIDSIHFDQKVLTDLERFEAITNLVGSLKEIPGKKYYAMTNEVTQAQWRAIMVSNPSKNQTDGTDDYPVENLTWYDIKAFLFRLNQHPATKNFRFRLPIKEEWDYTCRAGSSGAYTQLKDGTEISVTNLSTVAWYKDNSDLTTHSICQKQPNAYGIYDMLGNVSEWVRTIEDGKIVCCGGNWSSSSNDCQIIKYGRNDLTTRRPDLGFRLFADRSQ